MRNLARAITPRTLPLTVLGAALGVVSMATPAHAATVRNGDTLSGIAARNGVTVAQLRSANGLSGSTIHPGQKLRIPGPSHAAASRASSRSAAPAAGGYRARSGDTLSHIAARNGVSVAALRRANPNIDPSRLQVGQRVRVPSASSSQKAGSKRQAVGTTFLGRTYAPDVTRAANSNHATLSARSAPSRAQMKAKIRSTAGKYGVDPSLALAIAHQESSFDHRAVSPANAVGAMQVTPSAGRWASQIVGRNLDLTDPDDNVTAGVIVLRANLRAAGDTNTGVAAYYQGLHSVRQNGLYSDTKSYVAKVSAHRGQYR